MVCNNEPQQCIGVGEPRDTARPATTSMIKSIFLGNPSVEQPLPPLLSGIHFSLYQTLTSLILDNVNIVYNVFLSGPKTTTHH